MANNFELVILTNQSIVSGDADSFCAGTGSIRLSRTVYNNGLELKGSIWNQVSTIRWDESSYSSSNIGYYDADNNWISLSPSMSWSGSKLTLTSLNMPSGEISLFVAQGSSADVTYSNLEILDANGNSLLESSEPSTGLPLYIGNTNIQAVNLGSTNIPKMYIGSTLIYEDGGGCD